MTRPERSRRGAASRKQRVAQAAGVLGRLGGGVLGPLGDGVLGPLRDGVLGPPRRWDAPWEMRCWAPWEMGCWAPWEMGFPLGDGPGPRSPHQDSCERRHGTVRLSRDLGAGWRAGDSCQLFPGTSVLQFGVGPYRKKR